MTKNFEEENTRTYKLVDKEGFLSHDDINAEVVDFIGFDTKCEVNLFTGFLDPRDNDTYGYLMIEGPTPITPYELANYFEEVGVVDKVDKKKIPLVHRVLNYCGVYIYDDE